MKSASPPPDDPVIVHRALLALAKQQRADFNAILVQYAIERLIDRLARSAVANQFVLKGAMLFRAWTGELHRPTKDVDLLGFGDSSPAAIAEAVRSVVRVESSDGLRFDPESIHTEEIREGQEYEGVRATVTAFLAHVPIKVRIDVGFGDAVTPGALERPFPTLIGHAAPLIRAYPPETSVAEKVEAMCVLGIINSRMKDYHDVIVISRRFEFDGDVLAAALQATFARRATLIPTGVPSGLSDEFGADEEKQRQWSAYVSRMRIDDLPADLPGVIGILQRFILPVLLAAGPAASPPGRWTPATGWSDA